MAAYSSLILIVDLANIHLNMSETARNLNNQWNSALFINKSHFMIMGIYVSSR